MSWQFGSKLAPRHELLDQSTSSIFCILGGSLMYQGCIRHEVDCVLKVGVDVALAAVQLRNKLVLFLGCVHVGILAVPCAVFASSSTPA